MPTANSQSRHAKKPPCTHLPSTGTANSRAHRAPKVTTAAATRKRATPSRSSATKSTGYTRYSCSSRPKYQSAGLK